MEQTGADTRVQLLPPGLAIIIAVVGLIGATHVGWGYLRATCGLLGGLAGVIWLAQTVDHVLSRYGPGDDCAGPEVPRPRRIRLRFGLSTLLMTVTVAGTFLALSKWTRHHLCVSAFDGYVYGFPFPCVTVPNFGTHVTVDLVPLAANIGLGVLLVLGVALEAERFRSRRKLNELPRHKETLGDQ